MANNLGSCLAPIARPQGKCSHETCISRLLRFCASVLQRRDSHMHAAYSICGLSSVSVGREPHPTMYQESYAATKTWGYDLTLATLEYVTQYKGVGWTRTRSFSKYFPAEVIALAGKLAPLTTA
eukprot:3049195-Amphidinium_carterae.1